MSNKALNKTVKMFHCSTCCSTFNKVVHKDYVETKCIFRSCSGTAKFFERSKSNVNSET